MNAGKPRQRTIAAGVVPRFELVTLRRGITLGLLGMSYLGACLARRVLARAGLRRVDAGARGRGLARMFERMGPTFIKLGQLLSSRPDLVTPETASELARLRDRVERVPSAHIVHTIEINLGAPISELFSEFHREPISTGSIAQVHRAVLHDRRAVAVKVRKPGVAEQIAADFSFLISAGRLLERVPSLRSVPITALLAEFRAAIEAQVDFGREAQNNARFRESMKRRTGVRIPELVPQLCTEAVLTMEFFEDLTPIHELELSAAERLDAAVLGLRTLYQMIFEDGLAHADLHPGNVFFRRGPEVLLLDFGLVASLDGHAREQFRRFFLAMATNDGATCARVVRDTAKSVVPRFDSGSFTRAMEQMVDRFAGRRVRDFEVAGFATELFDLQRRFGLRGSTDFTMTIVSLLVFEGIIRTLAPELDFQTEASKFLFSLRPDSPMSHAQRADVFEQLSSVWAARNGVPA